MRWTPGGRSEDLEDRRDEGGGGGGIGGAHLGIGGFIILLILSVVFKKDFFSLLSSQGGSPGHTVSQQIPSAMPRKSRLVQFVSFVLDDTQKTWAGNLQAQGIPYQHAKLVLFRDVTSSGCGDAQSATGPFYCPADQKVYIDLGFYDELQRRFGAPGQFAQAYVLAHELGHHVQNLLGIERKVRNLRGQNPGAGNALSVRMEFRPIASPACGRNRRNKEIFWRAAMSKARSARLRPLETIACNACREARSVQTPSPMDRRRKEWNGFSGA